MINNLNSIDNTCHKIVDLAREIYLITSSNVVWDKWREVFEENERRELINPNMGRAFCSMSTFKQMKPPMRELF